MAAFEKGPERLVEGRCGRLFGLFASALLFYPIVLLVLTCALLGISPAFGFLTFALLFFEASLRFTQLILELILELILQLLRHRELSTTPY